MLFSPRISRIVRPTGKRRRLESSAALECLRRRLRRRLDPVTLLQDFSRFEATILWRRRFPGGELPANRGTMRIGLLRCRPIRLAC